jgi:hypothetical protein
MGSFQLRCFEIDGSQQHTLQVDLAKSRVGQPGCTIQLLKLEETRT